MIVAGLELIRMSRRPFLAQRLDRLRARVIELARLADDDRAGADQQTPISDLYAAALGFVRNSRVGISRCVDRS